MYDSLESLYKVIADDLCSDIYTLGIDKNSKLLTYVTYLSPKLSRLSDTVYEIVEGKSGSSIYDEADLVAVSRMCELLSYKLLKINEPV